jgi:hypothetical protein
LTSHVFTIIICFAIDFIGFYNVIKLKRIARGICHLVFSIPTTILVVYYLLRGLRLNVIFFVLSFMFGVIAIIMSLTSFGGDVGDKK